MRVPVEPGGVARAGLVTRIVTQEADLERLAPRWNALLDSLSDPSPFQSLEWIEAWWKAYGAGGSLHILLAEVDDDLLAAVPLAGRKSGPFRILRFLGSPRSDFVDALVRPGDEDALKAIFSALAGVISEWDVLHFQDLAEGSVLYRILKEAAPGLDWRLASRDGSSMPYLSCHRTWNEYLGEQGGHFRKRTRQEGRKLMELGTLENICVTDPPDSDASLQVMSAIESRSWKVQARAERLRSPEDRLFMREILARFGPRGWVSLWVFRRQGRPMAHVLLFRYRDRHYAYNTAFDDEIASYSPGRVLMTRAMEAAFTDGARSFELLRGAHGFKSRWTDTVRTNRDVVVWRSGIPGAAAAWAIVRARWVAQRSSLVKSLAAKIRSLRGRGGASNGAASA